MEYCWTNPIPAWSIQLLEQAIDSTGLDVNRKAYLARFCVAPYSLNERMRAIKSCLAVAPVEQSFGKLGSVKPPEDWNDDARRWFHVRS